jgi:hypothetical protein
MIGKRIVALKGERTYDHGVVVGPDGPGHYFVRWNSDGAETSYPAASLAREDLWTTPDNTPARTKGLDAWALAEAARRGLDSGRDWS